MQKKKSLPVPGVNKTTFNTENKMSFTTENFSKAKLRFKSHAIKLFTNRLLGYKTAIIPLAQVPEDRKKQFMISVES